MAMANYDSIIKRINNAINKAGEKGSESSIHIVDEDINTDKLHGLVVIRSSQDPLDPEYIKSIQQT